MKELSGLYTYALCKAHDRKPFEGEETVPLEWFYPNHVYVWQNVGLRNQLYEEWT